MLTEVKISNAAFLPNMESARSIDAYDLDISFDVRKQDNAGVNQLITSQSLCTPGCGNTGTMNSFCC